MKQTKRFVLLNVLVLLLIIVWPLLGYTDNRVPNEIPITCNSEEALQTFLKGREAFEMNRIGDAQVYFDEAIILEPKFPMAYLYTAYCSDNKVDKQNNIDYASRFIDKASKGEYLLLEMEKASIGVSTNTCSEMAEQLVKLYPLSSRALLIQAAEYEKQHDVTKFRDMVKDAITLEPNSPLGYRALAVSYLLDKPMDFSLAEKSMKKFAELRPSEEVAQLALGDVYRSQMKLQDAKESYTNALKINPKSDIAYAKRGYVNSFLGINNEAESDFKLSRNLSRDKQLPENYLQSFIYFSADNSVKPERLNLAYIPGIDASNAAEEHYFCCSVMAMSKGLYAPPVESMDESECLSRALIKESVAPDETRMYSNFAFLASIRAIQDGNFELANQMIDKFDELTVGNIDDTKSPVYNYLTGLNHMKQKQYGRAIHHYLKSDLTNACVKFELGMAYDGIGNNEKAKELFQEVLQSNFPCVKTPNMVKLAQKWNSAPVAINSEP